MCVGQKLDRKIEDPLNLLLGPTLHDRNLVQRVVSRIATQLAVLRGRKRSKVRIGQLPCRKMLVLCYGNIYRSPLAAELLRCRLDTHGYIEVRSAGFHLNADRVVPTEYVQRLKVRRLADLTAHRSKTVTVSNIEWADTIVIMDRHNWHALAQLAPSHLGKIVWLGAFLDAKEMDILDPYGRTDVEVEAIIEMVHKAVLGLVGHLNAVQNLPQPNDCMERLK